MSPFCFDTALLTEAEFKQLCFNIDNPVPFGIVERDFRRWSEARRWLFDSREI